MVEGNVGDGWLADHVLARLSANGSVPRGLNKLTMRVLLRNKETRRYYAARNEWGAAVAQALLFGSVPQAARFAFDEKVPQAEIVVRCDLVDQEVALPLLPEWCSLDQPPPPNDLTGLPLVNRVS